MYRISAASRSISSFVLCAGLALPTGAAGDAGQKADKPAISIKVSPSMGFAPFRVVLTAEVHGGPDDYEQFYCAAVEWDMGDGNRAEQSADCDPYEAGKSQIKRRYVREQVFDTPGEYHVFLRLKQKNKVVGVGQMTVRVRSGISDPGGPSSNDF